MTPEEKVIIQDLVDDIYNQFVDVIVKNGSFPGKRLSRLLMAVYFPDVRRKNLGWLIILATWHLLPNWRVISWKRR